MEMRPAAIDGRMMSSGEADPRSLPHFDDGDGNKLDRGHAQSEEHAHGIAGAGRIVVFCIEPPWPENTVALFPAPKMFAIKLMIIMASVRLFFLWEREKGWAEGL